MPSDNTLKKTSSLATALIEAAHPPAEPETISDVAKSEIQKFKKFYGVAASAIWDLFLTGDVEPERQAFYDRFFWPTDHCYFMAFCSGEFLHQPREDEPDSYKLGVNKDEWIEKDHNVVHEFFLSLDKIVKQNALQGFVLRDVGDMCILEVNNPYCMLKLVEIFLKKHDVSNLDDLNELCLKSKFKKLTPDKIPAIADRMREDLTDSADKENYSVGANAHINISYFPPVMSPTIDNADIAMFRALLNENTAPFSLQLLRNTYQDSLDRVPEPHCGLTLLH